MQVILDSKDGRLAFAAPRAIIRADTAAEVPAALAALEAARADGHWAAGLFSYELGYALEKRLAPLLPQSGEPLILFGVYDAPAAAPLSGSGGRAYAGPLMLEWDAAGYGMRFAVVKEAIAAGDIYQANLSFRAHFPFVGDPRAFYENLREAAQAPHCAFLDCFDQKSGGRRQIVSLSPELFFEIEHRAIRARPMKGTSPRSGSADAVERARLAASAKDRAENLMIVDLIRNDLGRVAQIGSVQVADLFAVETYPTLHTMVSTVRADLKPETGIAAIIAALFPCGSVTGAPKIHAMEILRALESSPRGAYCGAIGFFAPDSSARFNVAIRTLTIADNRGTLGIGGGVVQDSMEASEYAECLLKARFFETVRRPLELIETLRLENGFVRLKRHLERLERSAGVFNLPFDAAKAAGALDNAVRGKTGPWRVRLVLNELGDHKAEAFALPPNPPHWTYAISPHRISRSDIIQRHKTSWRDMYDEEVKRLGTDEVLFLNEDQQVAEGARSNIFIKRGRKFLTPPLSCGLLPGILRAELIENGECQEAVLTESDLVGELFFGNSLRGLIPAKPI